ncbi:MAG TPA: glycosyltransferase family 39 protein [Thermoanaerobaculaceae bacterium]|nr:glycosyltransferase family 39 protein [Thermoanaerobaculaceae bacterium]
MGESSANNGSPVAAAAPAPAKGAGRGWTAAHAWLAVGLAGYAALLLALRPATPFEWDEVLFQQALDRYDVAAHSPHPPGYPVYVAAGRAVRALVSDPLLALQLVAVASAVVALLLLWGLARRADAGLGAAAAALVILAVTPAFAFNADVGLSDVAGAATGMLALLALVVATDRPSRLPLAACAVALAAGIRPQVVFLLLPAGIATAISAVRGRAWRPLLLALGAGAAATLAIWAPAVAMTGAGRFLAALREARHYVATAERHLHLPGASPTLTLGAWLGRPFGTVWLAVGFWLLVVLGRRAWRRSGHLALARTATWAAVAYVGLAMWTMNLTTAVRYILPALPPLCLLAAGVLAEPRAWLRRAGAGLAAAWALAAAAWGAPVYALRRSPAPPWAAISWARGHLDPTGVTVAYETDFTPHVAYLLARAGFDAVKLDELPEAQRATSAGRETVLVTSEPVAGTEILFDRSWHSDRLMELVRGRYDRCVVARASAREGGRFPGAWERGRERWTLAGTGYVRLEDGAAPEVVRIAGGDGPIALRRPGWPRTVVERGGELTALLMPGSAGELALAPAAAARASLAPLEPAELRAGALPPGLARATIVPVVAAVHGWHESFWRTDLLLYNPQPHPLPVVLQFLPTGRDNREAPAIDVTLGARSMQELEGVLLRPEFARVARSGAMLVVAGAGGDGCADHACDIVVFSRTSNARAAFGADRIGEGLPGVPVEQALRGGQRAVFHEVSNDGATRTNLGVASWSASPSLVRITVLAASGQSVGADLRQLGPFGHLQVPLPGDASGGTVEVEAVGATPATRLFPYIAAVNEATQTPLHRLPDEVLGAPLAAAPPFPLPEREAAAP